MSDMKKLLEAMDSMSKAETKPTGPKFPGYWKGTDSASKAKDKMVGSAQESIIKELNKTAKDTATERKLKEEFAKFNEGAPELLKAEIPLVRELEQSMEDHGYVKGTEEHKRVFDQMLAFHRRFGNAERINQKDINEDFNSATCPKHGTYEFYGKHVPPCPKCGHPEAKTRDEYYKSMNAKKYGNKFNDNPNDNWSQDFERRMKQGVAEEAGQIADIDKKKVHLRPRKNGLAQHREQWVGVGPKQFANTPEQHRCSKCNELFGQQGVAESSDNITAVFSGYGNYMKGRGANVFKHYGITVLDQQYDEDEDIAEYTVSGSKEALDQARAYLERSDQFGGMILKQGVAEGTDGVDTITVDVPLLIRLLEYAREDAQTDMDLHNVAERLIDLSQEGRTLTMQDYDTICGQLQEYGNAQNPDAQTTTPGAAGAAQADAQNDAGAKADLATTQKNLSKLKAVDPTLNPQLANQALQTIDNNPAATVAGGQLKQTQGLADLVGDALADPQKGSQLATILQQVQQGKRVQ